MATINIGLHKNTGGAIPATLALLTLRQWGATVESWKVLESDSEPTLVAELRVDMGAYSLESISAELSQDCIAYVDSQGRGALYGDKADAWGPFNPAYFLTLEGARLGAPA